MNKAVFLDRDGVINLNTHYVNNLDDFHIFPYVKDSLMLLKQAGYKIFVFTNQGGIEKGFIKESELIKIHSYMSSQLPEIDDIRFAPSYDSFDRKPNPGMLYDLALEHEIFLSESWAIGDRITDCQAGKRAGCKTILLATDIMESTKYAFSPMVDLHTQDLLSATKSILGIDGHLN
jgi:D-glycero-D-manno-heptose 1,7-bisphosphate phosphatase